MQLLCSVCLTFSRVAKLRNRNH